jgi:glycosyltransferase involved in cell wall biosynthesis
MKKQPVISVIITAHHEGLIAHKTVTSVLDGLAKIDVPYEIVANLDNPDDATKEYFGNYSGDKRFVLNYTSLGDPGSARNAAIAKSHGKYVCVIDGDDMFSSGFFKQALELMAKHDGERIMVHPGATMQFGEGIYLTAWPQFDTISLEEDSIRLVGVNRWTAASLAEREVFLEHPYVPSINGFGYEDWWINQEVLAYGVTHYVTESVLFYRKKTSDSMFALHENDRTVVAYTALLEIEQMKRFALPSLERKVRMSAKGNLKRMIKFGYKVAIALPIVKIPALTVGRRMEQKLAEKRYNSLPKYLLDGWEETSRIEPLIEFSPAAAEHIVFESYEDRYIGVVYRNLVEHLAPNPVDRLYMVSGKLSRREKEAVLGAIRRDVEKHPDWHIVVLADFDEKIDGVDFVPFDKMMRELSHYEKDRLFSRLVVQLRTHRLVVCESTFFFDWIGDHQKYLTANKYNIAVLVLSEKYMDPYMIKVYPQIRRFVSFDKGLSEILEKQFALSPKKIKIVGDI